MTETTVDKPSPYEALRDGVPNGAVREAWRAGDAASRACREELQRVHEDETLTEEGKRHKAQQIIERYAAKAQSHYATAREKAEYAARTSYNFSIPMPSNQALATARPKDTGELLAIQGEAERIVQRIVGKSIQAMTKEGSRNPRDKGMKEGAGKRVAALQAEYERALALSGIEGKVLAHGVLRAAEQLGIDYDSVVEPFRNDRQRGYVEEAAQLEASAASIPSGRELGKNPYEDTPLRGGKNRIGTYSSANKAQVIGGRSQLFEKKKRRPSWK